MSGVITARSGNIEFSLHNVVVQNLIDYIPGKPKFLFTSSPDDFSTVEKFCHVSYQWKTEESQQHSGLPTSAKYVLTFRNITLSKSAIPRSWQGDHFRDNTLPQHRAWNLYFVQRGGICTQVYSVKGKKKNRTSRLVQLLATQLT